MVVDFLERMKKEPEQGRRGRASQSEEQKMGEGEEASRFKDARRVADAPVDLVEHLGFPMFESSIKLPLYTSVPCGFASPAEDYLTGEIDLNEIVMDPNHRAATFLARARGFSMIGAGIYDGNILVVDRALTPRKRSIVIATLRQEATCKRLLFKPDGTPYLKAENPHFEDRIIAEGDEFEIWGVVRYCLHSLL